MKKTYVILGVVGICLFFVLLKQRSFLTTPPTVQPAMNIISSAGKMQTEIDELTKQHVIKIQTLTNPSDITAANTAYTQKVKEIRDAYTKSIQSPV